MIKQQENRHKSTNSDHTVRLFCYYSFFSQLWFYLPIIVIYFYKGLGYTAYQVGYILFAYSMGVFLLEVPTGAFGDVYGRKKSILIGLSLKFFSALLFVFSSNFLLVFLANFLIGAGDTFISGSDTAYIYDYMSSKNFPSEAIKKNNSNFSALSAAALTVSAISGGIVAYYWFQLAFILSAICFLISIFFVLLFPAETFERSSRKILLNIKKSLLEYASNFDMRWISIYSIILFGFILAGFLLFQPYLSALNVDLCYFGIILGGVHFFTILGSKLAPHLEKRIGKKWYLFSLPAFLLINFILLSYFLSRGLIIGILFLASFRLIMGFYFSIVSVYTNETIKNNLRATILSINNLVSNIFSGLLFIVSGWLIETYSLSRALLFIGVVFLLFEVASFSIFYLNKNRKPSFTMESSNA